MRWSQKDAIEIDLWESVEGRLIDAMWAEGEDESLTDRAAKTEGSDMMYRAITMALKRETEIGVMSPRAMYPPLEGNACIVNTVSPYIYISSIAFDCVSWWVVHYSR